MASGPIETPAGTVTNVGVTDDNKTIIVAEVLPRSSNDPHLERLAFQTMQAIIEQPERSIELTEAFRNIATVQNPDIKREEANSRIKILGLKIGAGLSAASIVGAVGIAVTAGPVVIAVGLLSIGAACAGATMVLASGGTMKPEDFTGMLDAFSKHAKSSGDDK